MLCFCGLLGFGNPDCVRAQKQAFHMLLSIFSSFCLLKRQRNNLGVKEKSLCPVFFRASHPSDGGLNGSSARRRLLSHLRLLSHSFHSLSVSLFLLVTFRPQESCRNATNGALQPPQGGWKVSQRQRPSPRCRRTATWAQQLVKNRKRGPNSLLAKLLTANKCSLRDGGGKTRTERMLSVPGLNG